jgi:hypothetical protein
MMNSNARATNSASLIERRRNHASPASAAISAAAGMATRRAVTPLTLARKVTAMALKKPVP